MTAYEQSRPVSRAAGPTTRHGATRRANPPGRRVVPHHWPDEDIARGQRDEARELRLAEEEALRLDEEPATRDGGWDG